MVAAGSALLETHNPDNIAMAGEIFESLYKQDSTDKAAIAGLVAAYALSDASKLSSDLLNSLPQAERLVANIDVATLENAGVPSLPTSAAATSASAKRSAPKAEPPKPKKIRKSRMPKDFIEGRTMDPERWLPMRDRTYYRPKGRKGKKKMEGLTQGGAVAEEKAHEQQKTGGAGGGQQKKAKKKGKGKW
jgi:signal recognition particle subunit SRP72